MADLLGGPDWKVFQVTEYEWFVARSRDEAIAAACSLWGCSSPEQAVEEEMLDLDEVLELDAEAMDALRFTDTDEDENAIGEPRSFREELRRRVEAGLSEGELFAMSEP